VKIESAPKEWRLWARQWVAANGTPGEYMVLHEGPSPEHPDVTQRLEVVDLRKPAGRSAR
jgi:hypothetical protein